MKKRRYNLRILSLSIILSLGFGLVILRLFYWQVLAQENLANIAKVQYQSSKETTALRGEIFGTDNFPLVVNKKYYYLFGNLLELKEEPKTLAKNLSEILVGLEDLEVSVSAAKSEKEAKLKEKQKKKEGELRNTLENKNLTWAILDHKISQDTKEKIEAFNWAGLGFEKENFRYYPEASMASHLLGFVGKNETGEDAGYFGLEGFYELALRGKQGMMIEERDAANEPILIGSYASQDAKDGQNLILYFDRSIQFVVEEKLKKAVEKTKAKSGTVLIMDPYTGGILALASYPSFDPATYYKFDKSLYQNPSISELYEPGSTFKIFTMAAGLDAGEIKMQTRCDICTKPLKIDKYEIKTWDEKYHPDASMAEVLQYSDNVGMVFVSRKLGLEKFLLYLNNFGFGQATNIDLQGESSIGLRPKDKWSEVDLATAAFGQGISVTGIQMVAAASAIANEGNLLEPHVVKEIISGDKRIEIGPKLIRRVIKPETAKIVKKMMVQAIEKGEAKKYRIPGYKIAGKTGTAQIPLLGHYDEEKTIASFIGFAPVDKPRFVMLTTLKEPKTSVWGSETAAPLFFEIAQKLIIYFGIQPD